MDAEKFSEIRESLLDRRRELIDLRRSLDESWQRLHEPEKELEETASKETMSRGMEQRSERIQAEIRNIDNALTKMEEGHYGRCEACRRPINVKRLHTIPWARHCVQCASVRETLSPGGVDSQAVATGGAALTDEEMLDAILDELQSDGRIEFPAGRQLKKYRSQAILQPADAIQKRLQRLAKILQFLHVRDVAAGLDAEAKFIRCDPPPIRKGFFERQPIERVVDFDR